MQIQTQEAQDARVEACRRHRAARSSDYGWTECVAGGACSGAAHGCVVQHDECRCGARRRTEINGDHSASSGWRSPRV